MPCKGLGMTDLIQFAKNGEMREMTDDLVKRLRYEQSLLLPESNWRQLTEQAADRIEQLEAALRDLASGKYSGRLLPSLPPQDPAVFRAKQALGDNKDV
jgi:hypothetical protein